MKWVSPTISPTACCFSTAAGSSRRASPRISLVIQSMSAPRRFCARSSPPVTGSESAKPEHTVAHHHALGAKTMKLRGILITGTLSLLTLTGVALAAQDKLAQLREQGFARIAIANEPPFTAVGADGKVTGAAPDVARVVFKKLGVNDIVASVSEYGAMIPGLAVGRHDAIAAGLFMTPQRCAAVAYSEPVLCALE